MRTPAADPNTLAVIRDAERLYMALGKAGFTRDSFIELGESVKKDVPFASLHPAVITCLVRIIKAARE